MLISLIWAMTDDRVIGIKNRLPWKLPADMKWFRQHTLGKPVIMGRSTFESFGAKPLPDRLNIVISSNPDYQPAGAVSAHSLDDAIGKAGDVDEVMIIGGSSIYTQMLSRADRLYMTLIHADIEGDAWFPEFDQSKWSVVEQHDNAADENNPFDYSFTISARNPSL